MKTRYPWLPDTMSEDEKMHYERVRMDMYRTHSKRVTPDKVVVKERKR